MKYAVEARIFNNGKFVAKMRPAGPDEESGCRETRTCDLWIAVLDDASEAIEFLRDYKRA